MKNLIFLIVGLYTSFSHAQTPDAQCSPYSPSCSKKHTEEDVHNHDHSEEEPGPPSDVEEKQKEHDHDEHNEKDDQKAHGDHGDEHGHSEGEEHGHDEEKAHGHVREEGSSQVGPEKGVLEASESKGFKLSPEAIKNFNLKYISVEATSLKLPAEAILHAKEEKSIYRLRDGFLKRVDFKVITRSRTEYSIESKELKSGDQVLVRGLGFVRMAEIAAFGGAPEGHSH